MRTFISLLFLIGLPFAAAVAQPEIEVRKSVNNAFPAADEPIEFTVQVSNIGDEVADNVIISDQLPPEMEIPAGTAAFASMGEYDPATGSWVIGSMGAGADATLIVPAVVTDPQPPACIVNSAVLESGNDSNPNNNEARAGIHQNGIERCVDLSAQSAVIAFGGIFASCDAMRPYEGTIDVRNMGPDAARNVIVSFVQAPVVGANIRFDDARCAQSGSEVCEIAELAVGEFVALSITSDSFQNYTSVEYQMAVSVSTSDVDYVPENDLTDTFEVAGDFSNCEEIDFGGVGFGVAPGGGCFIATAAYGSALDPHLDSLRYFRDSYLLTNGPGRTIVAFYYRYSPPLADFIADHDWLRAIVRTVLTPIVYAIEYPGLASLAVIAMVALLVSWRQRKRKNKAQSLVQT